MSDILLAFRDFLLRDEPMADPVRESGSLLERDTADPGGRQGVRSIIDWKVFDARQHRLPPSGTTGPLSITLESASEITYGAIAAPLGFIAAFVDLNIWARDTDEQSGSERARKLTSCLRQYMSQYRGPLNGDVNTQTIKLEAGPNELASKPADASGNWTYRYLSTWMLGVTIETPTGEK